MTTPENRRVFDAAVVGPGPVGLASALALAQAGFSTALVGMPQTGADARTVALLEGSVAFLKELGAWPGILPQAAPMRAMRIIDDTGSLFRPPPATFESQEIGLEAFGWNVENRALVAALDSRTGGASTLARYPVLADRMTLGEEAAVLSLADGTTIAARLVIACDGRNSRLREGSGLGVRHWSYPQVALTALLAHRRPHRDASTEFHTREGPFTLVPMAGQRSSLVWVCRPERADEIAGLPDDAFAARVERQAHSLLGAMTVDGPRGRFPLSGLSAWRFTAPRLALAGETAHVIPPIGAQGLNLGLRDAAALRDAAVAARKAGEEIGGPAMLRRYESGRSLDAGLRTLAVDGLNRSLLADIVPADFLRGAGLIALSRLGPLRRAVMREGVRARQASRRVP